ncbi:hypothetical protein TRVA0_001S04434 [Trichomonascus vanleenenianus]|uniref:uncharacterized protein n=1 Tax=Trichomonascus vanleenenianus TaxID=2268995 RepID=UPI003ECA52BC
MFVDLDDKFAVQIVEPRKFSVSDALDVGEFALRTVQKDAFIRFIQGTPEDFTEPSAFAPNFAITDPRQRLRDVIRKAKLYTWATFCWADNIHKDVIGDRSRPFVLHEKSSGRVVGLALWKYPDYMLGDLNRQLGRTGLWWFFQKLLSKLHYQYLRYFKFNYGFADTLMNERRAQAFSLMTPTPILRPEELAKLSYDELCQESYAHNDCVHLRFFFIASDLQRKGLGNKFFNFCLDHIPNEPITFSDGIHTVQGPQKIELASSPAGKALYIKNGFKAVKCHEKLPDGSVMGITEMERNR